MFSRALQPSPQWRAATAGDESCSLARRTHPGAALSEALQAALLRGPPNDQKFAAVWVCWAYGGGDEGVGGACTCVSAAATACSSGPHEHAAAVYQHAEVVAACSMQRRRPIECSPACYNCLGPLTPLLPAAYGAAPPAPQPLQDRVEHKHQVAALAHNDPCRGGRAAGGGLHAGMQAARRRLQCQHFARTLSASSFRNTQLCGADRKPNALSRCVIARSKALKNLYLRKSASHRSQRRRHLSRLPPLPGGESASERVSV